MGASDQRTQVTGTTDSVTPIPEHLHTVTPRLVVSDGAIMATYWENVDAAWARAVDAGAEILFPLADQFYGVRGGRLRDPFGQQWMLSQRIEALSHEEIVRRARHSSDSRA